MHGQCIQQLLTIIPIDSFHDPAQNIIRGLEISYKIIDGLLEAKETGEKLHLEFVKTEPLPVTRVSLKQPKRVA